MNILSALANPAQAFAPTSDSIRSSIASELAGAENAEAKIKELREQRGDVLLGGDDKALGRLEDEIDALQRKASRHRERLTLLDVRLTEAADREHNAELDALASRAEKARAAGERLITSEYPKLAKPLVDMLRKLSALESLVQGANDTLQRNGRETVNTANIVRCWWRHQLPSRTAIANVGPWDPRHPEHADAVRSENGIWASKTTHGRRIQNVDIEVVVPGEVVNDWLEPLEKAVCLPRLRPDQAPLWGPTSAAMEHDERERVLKGLSV